MARVLSIRTFLTPLLDDCYFLDPYLPEAIEHLVDLIPQTRIMGLDPLEVVDLIRMIEMAQAHRHELSTLKGLNEAINSLRESAALLFAFVGEVGKAIEILQVTSANVATLDSSHSFPEESLLQCLRRDSLSMQDSSEGRPTSWNGLLKRWEGMIRNTKDGVLAPVIARSFDGVGGTVAELRLIRLEIFGRTHDATDRIHSNVGVAAVQDANSECFAPALDAARHLLRKKHAPGSDIHVSGRFLFEQDQSLHCGESANLGMAALAFSEFTRMLGNRERYSLRPAIGLTGGIDSAGRVRRVSEDTLPQKVSTVFFSFVEHLVVPKEQFELVTSLLSGLRSKYPKRRLMLHGVSELSEIFFDRRLTDFERLGRVRYSAIQLWRHRRLIAAVVFAGLLLVIARLWYGPLDKNPVQWFIENASIVLRNAGGEIVERIPIGQATSERASAVGRAHPFSGIAALVDIDGDQQNEVVWAQTHDNNPDSPGEVLCKAVGESSPRWTVSLQRMTRFHERSDIAGDAFRWHSIMAGDFNRDGKADVYILAHHSSFPSLLLQLDGATGREIGAYIHAGHLLDMRTTDLDGDEVPEILLCGVNNSYRSACLVVLDSRHVHGYSPVEAEGSPALIETDCERAYVLIPKTIVANTFPRQVAYNIAENIRLHENTKEFSITVRDANIVAGRRTDTWSSTIFPHFDYKLQMLKVETGDDFDNMYRYISDSLHLPTGPRSDYVKAYVRDFNARNKDLGERFFSSKH